MAEAAHSQVYRRRRPERSVAYRALTHHFERFLQVYEDRFEPTFGYLRSVVARVVYRYLDCGLLEQGFAPLKWAEWAGEELLGELASCAWLPDGTFRHLLYFDAQKVERLFRAEVLRMLFEKGRIDADTVNNMLSWPHSG